MAEISASKSMRDEDLLLEYGQRSSITVTSTAPTIGLAESEKSSSLSYSIGTFDYAVSSDGTYMIVTGIGQSNEADVVIPAEFGGLPVREIAPAAFREEDGEHFITSVVLPNTITRIGDRAFANCWKLRSVTIPNSVRSIGGHAFTGCGYLTNVTFEDSNTRAVFFDNSVVNFNPLLCTCWGSNGQITISPTFSVDNIHCFEIPEEVSGMYFSSKMAPTGRTEDITTSLTNNASWFCGGDFTVVNGVTQYKIEDLDYVPDYKNNETNSGLRLGDYAFNKCEALTEITLPRRLENMGTYVFNECEYLENVTFIASARVTEIPEGTFSVTDLNNISLSNGIVRICEKAFYDCHGLGPITIPNRVKYIGPYAFAEGSITGVNFAPGSKIEEIGTGAFSSSINITEFVVPASLTKLGRFAFRNLASLNITFADPYTWFATTNAYFTDDYKNGTLIHPDFLSGKGSSAFPNQTPGTVLIGEDATYAGSNWYKIKRMPKPQAKISSHVLTAVDPLGVAEEFHIYVNGTKRVTIYPET